MQQFEVFIGDTKSLRARLVVIQAAGATAISFIRCHAASQYIILYTNATLVAGYQSQT